MLLLTKDLFSDAYIENILAFLIYAHCVRKTIPANYNASRPRGTIMLQSNFLKLKVERELHPPAELQLNSTGALGEYRGFSAEIR